MLLSSLYPYIRAMKTFLLKMSWSLSEFTSLYVILSQWYLQNTLMHDHVKASHTTYTWVRACMLNTTASLTNTPSDKLWNPKLQMHGNRVFTAIYHFIYYTPATRKWWGILLSCWLSMCLSYHLSVCLGIHPWSVYPSKVCPSVDSFFLTDQRCCMYINIQKSWVGIVFWLFPNIFDRVTAHFVHNKLVSAL